MLNTAAATPTTAAQSTIAHDELKGCAFVDPPRLVDGALATAAEMQRLTDQIHDYVESMQQSLACLDRLLANPVTRTERQSLEAIYNNGVDQLNFVVGEYNKQVRTYRMTLRVPDVHENP
jgi:hypothetical protein